MNRNFFQKKFFKIILIFILFCFFDFVLNFTLYNPSFVTPIYGFFINHRDISVEEEDYPLVSVGYINRGFFTGPRASVEGVVEAIQKSGDGDVHVNIRGSNGILVAETIKEVAIPLPAIGEKIHIWGIVRYDVAHRWWELHPVLGWNKLSDRTLSAN